MGKKTEEDFRAKLEKSKGKKRKGTKILFIIIVTIMIGVISWFVTTTRQKDSKEVTPTTEPASITLSEINGVRLEIPGNFREIAPEDTTVDEAARDVTTFDAKEFYNSDSTMTYKVFVGYPDELPTDSFGFEDFSNYLINVRDNGWSVTDEEQIQFGTHLIATKETTKDVVSDLYVLHTGTDVENSDAVFVQTYHDSNFGSINITQTGLQRTEVFNESTEDTEYAKLNRRIDWVSAIKSAINDGKTLKQIVGIQDIEVNNWVAGSTIYDEEGVQIKFTGIYLDVDNNNYAVALEVQNDSVEESNGFKGYRINTALQMGVGDEPLWLNNGYNDSIIDIRNLTVPKGETLTGYAFFEIPKDSDKYNKYTLRYYKFTKAGNTDINQANYIEGIGELGNEVPFVSKH